MDTLGVGMIGFGFIGKVHAYGYNNIPLYYDPLPARTRLGGVATSRPATAEKAVEQGGFEFGTDDWRELIDRSDINIINICSPNSLHCDQLVAAMEAGKHIYCDKPLVVTAEEAARVEAAMQSWTGIGQMTLQYRFYPPTLRAKQLIEEGFLGNVVTFRSSYLHSGSVDPNRPMGRKQLASEGGGVIQDLGSHNVDLLDWLIGPFASVLAESSILYEKRPNQQGEIVPVEAEDHAVMLVKLSNGALGHIEATKLATGTNDELRFEIHGDQGALRFNLMDPNYLEAVDLREAAAPRGGQRGWRKIATVQHYEKPAGFPSANAAIGWIRGHMHCLCNFVNAVATGKPPEPSLQRGLHLRQMLEVIGKSAATRTWQQF